MKRAIARVVAFARRHPDGVDGLVALGFAVAALIAAELVFDDVARFDPEYDRPTGIAVGVAMLTVTLPLAARRRAPLATTLAVSAAFVFGRQLLDVYEPAISVLAVYFGLYSGARHGAPRWRTPVLGAAIALVVAEIVDELFLAGAPEAGLRVFLLVYNLVIVVLPLWLGSTMRARQRREAELVTQAIELQHEREENARRAVFEERVRIARELHDVVAHHVSVMGIQAAAARRVLATRPASAATALVAIEDASRHAVDDMARLLGFLRREGEVDRLAPQPAIGEVDELVDEVRRAGVDVRLRVEGSPGTPMPRTVEVSAYRIVQEALTNTLKHSGGRRATVVIRYCADALEVQVDDDGTARSAVSTTAGGHGLIGMRERVSLHGGHLRVGPRPTGGFTVHARLPLSGAAP